MGPGLEAIYRILAEYPDHDLIVPVVASGLDDPAGCDEALAILVASPHPRAPREIIRHWQHLSVVAQQRTLRQLRTRLLEAARQLVRSDHASTRENLTRLASAALEGATLPSAQVLSLLLLLIDDPLPAVREQARHTFLRAILAEPAPARLVASGRDPLVRGLAILLRALPQHQDPDLIEALLALGPVGSDLLERALGEQWEAGPAILTALRAEVAPGPWLERRVEALLRWLRSGFPEARDAARQLLRERTDAAFLASCAARLMRDGAFERGLEEQPLHRLLRWDLLPAEALRELPAGAIARLAAVLQEAPGAPEEKATRLARLLPAASEEGLREVLKRLREVPTATLGQTFGSALGPALEPVLQHPDPTVQLLATELISPAAGRSAFRMLVRQLGSQHEEVRALAQRKLSGQSLGILLESSEPLTEADRRAAIQVLRRVDLHFHGQLRRALRSPEEATVVRALRLCLDLDDRGPIEDALHDLTVSPSARIRATLVRVLGRAGGAREMQYLRLFLDDPDARVVANAVEALGDFGDPQAASLVAGHRAHPHHRVRTSALLALHRDGDPAALGELEVLTRPGTSSSALRMAAAWALDQIARRDKSPATAAANPGSGADGKAPA